MNQAPKDSVTTETRALTLTEFLLARIAEDEGVARTASEGHHWAWEGDDLMSDHEGELYSWGTPMRECIIATEGANPPQPDTTGAHIARHDPARVLAECEAKRRIVERALGPVAHAGQDIERRAVLRDLASVYADHPDHREEWSI